MQHGHPLFLATDACSRKALTCLPGGPTALDNGTFVTMTNCSLGGIAHRGGRL